MSTIYTFTNCGITGPIGPTQAQLDSIYKTTNLSGLVTSINGIQKFIIPMSGTYRIECSGAARTTYSGKGANITGDFFLNSGDILYILVGQQGGNYAYGTGSGGTFVAKASIANGSYDTSTPLIVAGGAGAYCNYPVNSDASISTSGNAGSSTAGGTNGYGGIAGSSPYPGGAGAGFFGDGTSDRSNGPAPKAFIHGGTGGKSNYYDMESGGFGGGGCSGQAGGAGGGGYSGGGCGNPDYSSGGGGGSYNSGTNQTNTIGNIGDGIVKITFKLNAPSFTGNLSFANVHNSDIQLSGTITDTNSIQTIQYKISLNGNQIYPTSGYTEFETSPVSINYTIPNNLLTLLTNSVTIDCINSYGLTSTNSYNVSVYNNMPTGILTSSNTTIHGDDIIINGTLSDKDLDQISYRILLNHNELTTWSRFIDNPTINYTILNSLLNIGDNIITIEYKDNFKNSLTNVWTQIVTKTNNTSIINIQYINGSIIGNIIDPDSDLTKYKILINGVQKYPESDFTEFNNNSTINYQINRKDILIGKDNLITIIARDNFGSEVMQDISFTGEYIGLIFMDEQKKYYTTDIGELLKYLDFGIITLGQITEPIKILVQNKYGFKIKDINLFVKNSLPNVNIEFSKEENPFIATENLTLEKEYAINEEDYFYIRLNTNMSINSVSGEFKIFAKASPIN